MAKKLTLRQQEKLFRERQRQNFQASSALDGLEVEVVSLDNEKIAQRLAELRGTMNDKLVDGADPYYYPGINVLKNSLDIREAHRLQQAELAFTALRAAAMPLGPAVMGLPHLCAIHLSLFQDIYPWAGEFREIDIYKDDTQFCHFGYIENEGNALMQELEEEEFLVGLPLDKLAERLAHYYTGLNLLHPFREGNGRVLRIFVEQLVIHAGYDIDWSSISRERWLSANKTAVFGDETDLVAIFNEVISEIDDEH